MDMGQTLQPFVANVARMTVWQCRCGYRCSRGLTMVELIVVMGIAMILALVAVPSFRDALNSMRQNSAIGLLTGDLNLARGEAIKRNARVLVCSRNPAATDCGSTTNWASGWLVCADSDGDNSCDDSTSELPNPLVVRPALDPSLTLAASAATLRFNANSSQGSGGTPFLLTVGGTWAGAVNRVISVAGTGSVLRP